MLAKITWQAAATVTSGANIKGTDDIILFCYNTFIMIFGHFQGQSVQSENDHQYIQIIIRMQAENEALSLCCLMTPGLSKNIQCHV